jgi:hypothetical protein
MKKQVKKLVLAKETVRNLTSVDLREVTGGITWDAMTCGCGTHSCRICNVEETYNCETYTLNVC